MKQLLYTQDNTQGIILVYLSHETNIDDEKRSLSFFIFSVNMKKIKNKTNAVKQFNYILSSDAMRQTKHRLKTTLSITELQLVSSINN